MVKKAVKSNMAIRKTNTTSKKFVNITKNAETAPNI